MSDIKDAKKRKKEKRQRFTIQGRIVYERRKHVMTWRDVMRLLYKKSGFVLPSSKHSQNVRSPWSQQRKEVMMMYACTGLMLELFNYVLSYYLARVDIGFDARIDIVQSAYKFWEKMVKDKSIWRAGVLYQVGGGIYGESNQQTR